MMFGGNDGGGGDGRISVTSSNTDTSLDTTAAVQGEFNVDATDIIEHDSTRSCIDANDPSITQLKIAAGTYMPKCDNWAVLGSAIGRNTHIKELVVGGSFDNVHVAIDDLLDFFRGMVTNKSITKLKLVIDAHFYGGEIFTILFPFFHSNPSLDHLEIENRTMSPDCADDLIVALQQFNSLRVFKLVVGDIDRKTSQVIDTLTRHHLNCLREVDFSSTPLREYSCSSLSSLLTNPNCKVNVVKIANCSLTDELILRMEQGFMAVSTLEELDLQSNLQVVDTGWTFISSVLDKPGCALKKLNLRNNKINDNCAFSIFSAIDRNKSLKTLNIGKNEWITISVWERFFSYLEQTSDSQLTSIDVSKQDSQFNDARVAVSIARDLLHNKNLTELDLSWNTDISGHHFVPILQSPTSTLKKLNLSGTLIDDETLVHMSNALANNKVLTELSLVEGTQVSRDNNYSDLVRVLCNVSNVMGTYDSNHTLEKLCHENDEHRLPDILRDLLSLNRDKTKAKNEVARIKIIKNHFRNGGSFRQEVRLCFFGIEIITVAVSPSAKRLVDATAQIGCIPHAIAWTVKDEPRTTNDGLTLLYNLLHTDNLQDAFKGRYSPNLKRPASSLSDVIHGRLLRSLTE